MAPLPERTSAWGGLTSMLDTSAKQAAAIAGHAEYKEARPGQVTVAEVDLVAEVKKILAAQAEDRAKAVG